MRIEQLHYIAAVTRLGSLRRAAEELHVSQPALSETIRNLERELGVSLLDRRRSGARISVDGRELLPHIMGVLESVERLNQAADQQHHGGRMVRIGTVNAATVALLTPAIRAFRSAHPQTPVEVVPAQQADIHRSILEGSLDLGVVNVLSGDDLAVDLDTTELLRGRVVACLPADNPLAELDAVTPDDLLTQPLIAMRAGYVMHRYLHRLFGGQLPPISYSMDGAEMGKLMVAEGLGITLLPDYSVDGDPLQRYGAIVTRPILGDDTEVLLLLQGRAVAHLPGTVRAMHQALVERASTYRTALAATA
jgi:DNA-binding transcriptional LysR family regulator